MKNKMTEVNKRFIVKIQVSIVTTEKNKQVLIYNRSKNISYSCPMYEAIDDVMDDRKKAFFYAKLMDTPKGLHLEILEEAPMQRW